MSWPAFHQGIGKQTAFLCLAAIAVIGFTVGGLTTGWRQDAQRETQGQSTGLGINVDTQDLRRVSCNRIAGSRPIGAASLTVLELSSSVTPFVRIFARLACPTWLGPSIFWISKD